MQLGHVCTASWSDTLLCASKHVPLTLHLPLTAAACALCAAPTPWQHCGAARRPPPQPMVHHGSPPGAHPLGPPCPWQDPPFDAGSFAEGVTYDATPAAGAPAACAPRVRSAWATLARLGASEAGRGKLRDALRLCE